MLRLARHRGTTAHVCSLYPWSVQAGLGHRGVYVGHDVLAGGAGFVFDPFEAYADGLVTNPNVWVMGEPGNGKSALVKTLLWRMRAVYGATRFVAVCDPKAEYRPLAEALGLSVVALRPGGAARINPLEATGAAGEEDRGRRQVQMLTALAATVLGRPLGPVEDAVLWATVEHLHRHGGRRPPTLVDVVSVLRDPPGVLAERVNKTPVDLVVAVEAVTYGLDKLLSRSLRGMFDGPSTVRLDATGPGLVLDLSAVYQDRDALPVVMVAATAWLSELMTATERPKVQLLDEVWGLLGNRATAGHLQACWKLGRTYGVANIGVCHRPSDLAAQADDGTATAKIASGLLADTATKIVLRQAPDQLAATAGLLGLNDTEAATVGHLVRGRALWRIGARTAVVHHVLGPTETGLVDTDAAMRRSEMTR
ncbi:MAG: ATP-binding protein [Actinobacteria bacterium]|nr:ATP-binding protein [Actinomycetota bacterium]